MSLSCLTCLLMHRMLRVHRGIIEWELLYDNINAHYIIEITANFTLSSLSPIYPLYVFQLLILCTLASDSKLLRFTDPSLTVLSSQVLMINQTLCTALR